MKNKKLVYAILIASGVLALVGGGFFLFNRGNSNKPIEKDSMSDRTFQTLEKIDQAQTINGNNYNISYEVLPMKDDDTYNYYLQITINGKIANYLWKLYSSKKEVKSLNDVIKKNVNVNMISGKDKSYYVISVAESDEKNTMAPSYVVFNELVEHIYQVPSDLKLELNEDYAIKFTNNISVGADAVYYLEYNNKEENMVNIHKVVFNNNKAEDSLIDKKQGKIVLD